MRTVSFFKGTAEVFDPVGAGIAAVFGVSCVFSSLMAWTVRENKSWGPVFSGFGSAASMLFSARRRISRGGMWLMDLFSRVAKTIKSTECPSPLFHRPYIRQADG
jgi:uncharacterized membrane protein